MTYGSGAFGTRAAVGGRGGVCGAVPAAVRRGGGPARTHRRGGTARRGPLGRSARLYTIINILMSRISLIHTHLSREKREIYSFTFHDRLLK